MNILFVSDDVYARHLVVAIKSIINHNEKGISFYIFDLGIKDEKMILFLLMEVKSTLLL